MTRDVTTSFLTYYVRSLGERTRVEKTGTKFGFDWVIYNLALSADWTPLRLPFIRGGGDEISRTKTEPEFGVDLAFVSADRKQLVIFVLKDEVLNNHNWTAHSFDIDLRSAAAPDLSGPMTREVTEVRVILAYNKDEDQTGIDHFDRLVVALGTKVGDHATLSIERWNLTRITELVRDQLLTPSLLPQAFFSHFNYICSQFGDFRHGSDEWNNQLVPNWRRFIGELLRDNPDERHVRLLPVALIILRQYGINNPSASTGWLDLAEWGMLAAWEVHRTTDRRRVKRVVVEMWLELYVAELEAYYRINAAHLAVPFSIDPHRAGGPVDAVASAIIAHWHLARMGLLSIALSEIPVDANDEKGSQRIEALLNTVAEWMINFLRGCPGARRPILDIHHIELVLWWRALWVVSREDEIQIWLTELQHRLAVRRFNQAELPFIDGHNSVESVLEHVITHQPPYGYCDKSSVFLVCMLELCWSLPGEVRDKLIDAIHRRLVLGQADCGKQIDGCKPIDLMLWVPHQEWSESVFVKSLAEDGECITYPDLRSVTPQSDEGKTSLSEAVRNVTAKTRQDRPFSIQEGITSSAVVLACLKHGSPLPPEFWRTPIFGQLPTPGSTELSS